MIEAGSGLRLYNYDGILLLPVYADIVQYLQISKLAWVLRAATGPTSGYRDEMIWDPTVWILAWSCRITLAKPCQTDPSKQLKTMWKFPKIGEYSTLNSRTRIIRTQNKVPRIFGNYHLYLW